jgi:hypothetical protein
MAQDSDVARVAAALKAPGLRYRSFGNEPVRAPRVDVSNVTDAYPLLGAAMEAAADDMASPELYTAEPEPTPMRAPVAAAPVGMKVGAALKAPGLRYRSFGNEPVREPRVDVSKAAEAAPQLASAIEPATDNLAPPEPIAPEPVLPAPEPVRPAAEPVPLAAEPAAPIFAEYVPPPAPMHVAPPEPAYAPPPPVPSVMPALFAQPMAQQSAPAPAPTPVTPTPAAAPAYSLLEALGRQSDLGPSMSASAGMPASAGYGQAASGPVPGGTFGNLLAGNAGSYGAPGVPMANAWGTAPGTALRTAPLLPAAAVTIPLSEVLRLVAVGSPAPSSPFDAFRAAVRAPGSR